MVGAQVGWVSSGELVAVRDLGAFFSGAGCWQSRLAADHRRQPDARHLIRPRCQLTERLGPTVRPAGSGGHERMASPSGLRGWPWPYPAWQPRRPAFGVGLRTSDRYRPARRCSTTGGRGKRSPHQAPSGFGAGECRTASTRRRRCAGLERSQARGLQAAGRSSWSPWILDASCRGRKETGPARQPGRQPSPTSHQVPSRSCCFSLAMRLLGPESTAMRLLGPESTAMRLLGPESTCQFMAAACQRGTTPTGRSRILARAAGLTTAGRGSRFFPRSGLLHMGSPSTLESPMGAVALPFWECLCGGSAGGRA
jgi:hypothetical protein